MKIANAADKLSFSGLATSAHDEMVIMGRRSRALFGAALFSIAGFVYFQPSEALILVAVLMVVYSILTIRKFNVAPSDSVVDNVVDKWLVSPVPEKPRKLVLARLAEMAGIAEQKTPDAETSSWRPVVQFINDDSCKPKPSPTQVRMFHASDPVCALGADTGVIVKPVVTKEIAQEESVFIDTPKNELPSPTVASVTKNSAVPQADTQTEDAMTAVAKVTTDSLLPTNVLKTTATEKAVDATVKVATDSSLPTNGIETSSTEKPVLAVAKVKKKPSKKFFKGEGVISYMYHTKDWGRIRLDTPTKWGETQVFFHRDHLSVAADTPLFLGQSVKLEYSYRRNNKGKQDSLRANSVELTTTGEKKWRSVVAPRPQINWRSRSMLRRPISPPTHPRPKASPPTRPRRKCPSPTRQVRVAKGPSVDGHRGFRFRRSA